MYSLAILMNIFQRLKENKFVGVLGGNVQYLYDE